MPGLPVSDTIKQVDEQGCGGRNAGAVDFAGRADTAGLPRRCSRGERTQAPATPPTTLPWLKPSVAGWSWWLAKQRNRKITDPNDLRWARQQVGDQTEVQ